MSLQDIGCAVNTFEKMRRWMIHDSYEWVMHYVGIGRAVITLQKYAGERGIGNIDTSCSHVGIARVINSLQKTCRKMSHVSCA